MFGSHTVTRHARTYQGTASFAYLQFVYSWAAALHKQRLLFSFLLIYDSCIACLLTTLRQQRGFFIKAIKSLIYYEWCLFKF